MSFRDDEKVETVALKIPTCDRCGKDLPILGMARRSKEAKYAGVVLMFVASAWPNETSAELDQTATRNDRLQAQPEGRDDRAVDLCPPCADAVYDRLTARLETQKEVVSECQDAQRFLLSCGCRAEWSGHRWRIVRRCRNHPTGAVPVYSMEPVYSMALLDE